jgi:hypothetical protein
MSVSRNLQLARMLATNEARHFGIAAHIDQVSRYAEIIAQGLGINASTAQLVRGAAKLHDFGKVATPDRILLKPGPLTAAERRVIELQTLIGYDLLRDSGSPLLDIAATIALSHHERWGRIRVSPGAGRARDPDRGTDYERRRRLRFAHPGAPLPTCDAPQACARPDPDR